MVKYGINFPEGVSDLDIELACFKIDHPESKGGLGRLGHYHKIVNMLWPYDKKRNPSGFRHNPWSDTMAEAYCTEKFVGVSGPSSSGKTQTTAVFSLIYYLADPLNTKVIITSTDIKSAKQRIWGQIVDRILNSAIRLPLRVYNSDNVIMLDGKALDTSNTSRDMACITLVAGSTSKAKEASGKIIGLKRNRVLLVIDEMTDVSRSILEACDNLNSNAEFRFIGMGNFKGQFDTFGECITPVGGWGSVTVEDDEWPIKWGVHEGKCLHFDALRSPNILHGDKWEFMLTSAKIQKALDSGEAKKASFWRFYRSFPCPEGADNKIYSEAELLRTRARDKIILKNPIKIIGCDVGFTSGGDKTIACVATLGLDPLDRKVFQVEKVIEIKEDVEDKNTPINFQIAKKLKEICEFEGVDPKHLGIDSTVGGHVFCDIVSSIYSNQILRVQFGGAASQLRLSQTDRTTCYEKYYNRVSELWFSGVELLRNEQLKGVEVQIAREMCEREYEEVNRKIRVQSKKEMKGLSGFSPDYSDAMFIALDVARSRMGLFPQGLVAGEMKPRNSWLAQTKKLDVISQSDVFLTL